MPNTALVTGASSGIGKEFARYHAALGGDLVITARRKEALEALQNELETAHGVKVHIVAKDLGQDPAGLIQEVEKLDVQIDILINNAGFGGHGPHIERPLDNENAMIALNIGALVALSHHFGAKMAERGKGKILNVGSTAGFMPGPLQAVYFATKAFVNSYSQAIDQELRSKGVTSTLLAPGYVETEFAAASNLEGTSLVASGGKTAASCAKHGYDAMMAGKLVTVNEPMLSFMSNWIVPLMPRRMMLKMVERMQSK